MGSMMKTLFCLAVLAVSLPGCERFLEEWRDDSVREFPGPRARLHGHVEINGEPASNHYVSIWWKGNGVSSLNLPTAAVDRNGDYDFGVIPAGEMILCVRPGSSYSSDDPIVATTGGIDLEDGTERAEDILIRAGSVSGRVVRRDDGAAITDVDVLVVPMDYDRKALSDGSMVSTARSMRVGRDGGFSFEPLCHGKWMFDLFAPRNVAVEPYRPPLVRMQFELSDDLTVERSPKDELNAIEVIFD